MFHYKSNPEEKKTNRAILIPDVKLYCKAAVLTIDIGTKIDAGITETESRA